MEQEARSVFADQGIARKDMQIVRGAEMRYFGQLRDLSINLPEAALGTPFTAATLADLVATFHERHLAMFGWGDPSLPGRDRAAEAARRRQAATSGVEEGSRGGP